MPKYYILNSIVHNKITYGKGEYTPKGIDETVLKDLFEHGFIAMVPEDGGPVIKYSKPVSLTDEEINKMLAWQPNDVVHLIKTRNITVESMKRVMELIKLPPVHKGMINKMVQSKEVKTD